MIETIKVRKCDICGKEMPNEHVIITWPDGQKEDVCHDCTKQLNAKLKEMRMGIKWTPINKAEEDMGFRGYVTSHCCEEFEKYKFDNQPNTEGGYRR